MFIGGIHIAHVRTTPLFAPGVVSCGLDAFTQCLEPYVSCLANPITDGTRVRSLITQSPLHPSLLLCLALAREGLVRSARSLEQAYVDGSNKAAREGTYPPLLPLPTLLERAVDGGD